MGKEIKISNKHKQILKKVNALREHYHEFTDTELQGMTVTFKKRFKDGESLDRILPDAYAVIREAAKRVLGLFPFDVQVIGAIILNEGNVAEMATGEGKTLTSSMAIYLNAISEKPVHVVTVNEYLAARDSEQMGELFEWMGLSVGLNASSSSISEKRAAYNADILYSTNSEIGFDYLRDNRVIAFDQMVNQRGHSFVLIDEVDSVLIDEGRTPLIISDGEKSAEGFYVSVDRFVKSLSERDYELDLESKTCVLTRSGVILANSHFGVENIFGRNSVGLQHYIDQSLRANYVMEKDIDYVVQDDAIEIVDVFTGRKLPGRRYSDGLHQAIEAKENVTIQNKNKTIASITYQNLFRLYDKISGMTGTASSESTEFYEIYHMTVEQVPTNKPIRRIDLPDQLYATKEDKYMAIALAVQGYSKVGQPVLVGTASVEASQAVSKVLNELGIGHDLLNAKNDKFEAQIIQSSGEKGHVTIATNMAGRGTDIKLGPGVAELGGLAVIGTERHESSRIDNQLRGRAGRQGDAGTSQFFISLDDDLIVRYGNEKIKKLQEACKKNGETGTINSRFLIKAISSCQKRVEGNNYDQRKNVLQYDDVLREQRDIIYKERRKCIDRRESISADTESIINRAAERLINSYLPTNNVKSWDVAGLNRTMSSVLGLQTKVDESMVKDDIISVFLNEIKKKCIEKQNVFSNPDDYEEFLRIILLRSVDTAWEDHIDEMDILKQGIQLRGYSQKNPIVEYKHTAFKKFNQMIIKIEFDAARNILQSSLSRK